jgi:ubiquinone/menaquinone biosynthesis C-methylase UbiE
LLVQVGEKLLDVECGLGGSARFFAQRFGGHATGIDLTPEYVEVADRLSAITGLPEKMAFDVGSALCMPYADSSFDGAITVHVAMNIADRDGLYREVLRVLKSGASFGIYDVMKGNTEPLDYPAPWAMTAETSHLLTQRETQESLERAGFRVVEVEDRTAAAKAFFENVTRMAQATGGPPPVGLHLLTGPTHAQKFANMLSAITHGRLAPAMLVARKP